MRAREGDLLQTKDDFIFDVKGLSHPPNRTVAFPRFIPDPSGDRESKGVTYKKIYQLSERYKFLETRLPYILTLIIFSVHFLVKYQMQIFDTI